MKKKILVTGGSGYQGVKLIKILINKGFSVINVDNNLFGNYFIKKDGSKPTSFTNNPKYFGKKISESSSAGADKKSPSFDGKKKFKSRSDRPKSFTFKKHSQKRAKV